MSSNSALPAPSSDASLRTRCVEDFQHSLQGGSPSPLEQFLPEGAKRLAVLVELVHVELEFRLKRGEPARVEEYLARYPELGSQPVAVRDLFAAEFRLRCRPGGEGDRPLSEGPLPAPPWAWPQLPGYEVLGELGRGAVGVVFRARQVGLNRLVAVKMLLAHWQSDADAVTRFHTEAKAVAALHHPNIVQMYDLGDSGGRPFFSMELVEGGTLDQFLAGRPLPPRRAAHLVALLARAMHQAHQRGVIHRDLKPSNVLLTGELAGEDAEEEGAIPSSSASSPVNPVPKITDFGLARFLYADVPATRTGQVIGTPGFMAPEQAAGDVQAVGPATDVHALGAIFYQCLTGRPPFQAPTALTTLEQVRTRDAVPVRQLQASVPRDLETVCLRCLEKGPAKRYPSAEALADDLDRFLRGEPIQARPAHRLERAGRWAWRNPVVAGLMAVVLALLVLGTAISTNFALSASREAAQAQAALADANRQRQHAANRSRRALGALLQAPLKLESPAYRDVPLLRPLREEVSEHALRSFRSFIDEDSADPLVRLETAYAYLHVGVLHSFTRRPDQARRAFRKAIGTLTALVDEFPQDATYRQELAQAYNHLGQSLREQGRIEEGRTAFRQALTHFRAALRLAPDDHRGFNNLAWVLVTSEDKPLRGPAEAVGYAERAIALAPSDGSSWNTLGVARHASGDDPGAIIALKRSLPLCRPGLEVYNWLYLAMANARLGNREEARRWYDKAHAWALANRAAGDDVHRLDEEAKRLLRSGAGPAGKP